MVHAGARRSKNFDYNNDSSKQTPPYYSWENVSYDTINVLQRKKHLLFKLFKLFSGDNQGIGDQYIIYIHFYIKL